ncbi:MAG: DUF4908 domain-containing protein [Alphaproteobacteria bacterium]|nr:MAG: DUF4908 domain-containing protein [Alphaproteobacteria bacterium]
MGSYLHLILATTEGYKTTMKWSDRARWLSLLVAASLAGALAAAPSVFAQELEEEVDPRIGLYSSERGENEFVLDRTSDFARMKFVGETEILQLQVVPGPRGDTFFKDDCGRTVLRLTPFGGATLYNDESDQGEAFGRAAEAEPLRLAAVSSSDAERMAAKTFGEFEEDYGYGMAVEVDYFAGSSRTDTQAAPLISAIDNTITALRRISRDEVGREVVKERLRHISFVSATDKTLTLEGPHLVVRYKWGGDISGVPSSAAILCYLENNL